MLELKVAFEKCCEKGGHEPKGCLAVTAEVFDGTMEHPTDVACDQLTYLAALHYDQVVVHSGSKSTGLLDASLGKKGAP